MTDHDLALAARIRLAMKESLMTQADFADMVGLTPDKLSKTLAGKRRVSPLELALMSEASGWTVERLLGMQIDVHGWHAGNADAFESVRRALPGLLESAYGWAVGMKSADLPTSMADFILDSDQMKPVHANGGRDE